MENGKVQNSEFENDQVEFTKCGPILGLLNRTIQKKHNHLKGSFISRPVSRADSTTDSVLDTPRYTFKITGYKHKDSVEYTVVLTENREVRGRICSSSYNFSTRYSKLLALHERMRSSARFPPKKFFNSTSPDFIEQRRQELEDYLNTIAGENNKTFGQFVSQIKRAAMNAQIKI